MRRLVRARSWHSIISCRPAPSAHFSWTTIARQHNTQRIGNRFKLIQPTGTAPSRSLSSAAVSSGQWDDSSNNSDEDEDGVVDPTEDHDPPATTENDDGIRETLVDLEEEQSLSSDRYPPAIGWETRHTTFTSYGDGQKMKLEFGTMGFLADCACVATVGGTTVMATVVKDLGSQTLDFLPLQVDYIEKGFAVSRIPGGPMNRRERQGDSEILTSRLIDRSVRPLFRDGLACSTDVVAQVLSYDGVNDPEILSVNAVSAALACSSLPWFRDTSPTPVAALRLGLVNSEYVVNPSPEVLEQSSLNLVVAASAEKVFMIEASADELPDEEFAKAVLHAQDLLSPLCYDLLDVERKHGFISAAGGKPAWPPSVIGPNTIELKRIVRGLVTPLAVDMVMQENTVTKKQRETSQGRFWWQALEVVKPVSYKFLSTRLGNRWSSKLQSHIDRTLVHEVLQRVIHDCALGWHSMKTNQGDTEGAPVAPAVPNTYRSDPTSGESANLNSNSNSDLEDGQYVIKTSHSIRVDGRAPNELRPITAQTSVLPVVHGSSLFTRGNTQTLCTVTLGSSDESIKRRPLGSKQKEEEDHFFLHYDFPQYSVGRVGTVDLGANRRAIGHGTLAEKALRPVLPKFDVDKFPYTVRVTSEVTSSDGSSSMATVCGASLALMDAGVPISAHVAGISVGIVEAPGEHQVLTDILGMEDHFGGMDYKIAGTRKGVTAAQLDVKIPGITKDVVLEAGLASREARLKVLELLDSVSPAPVMKDHVPRYHIIDFGDRPDLIGRLLGSGGRNIDQLQDLNGPNSCSVVVRDTESKVEVFASSKYTLTLVLQKMKEVLNAPEVAQARKPLPSFGGSPEDRDNVAR